MTLCLPNLSWPGEDGRASRFPCERQGALLVETRLGEDVLDGTAHSNEEALAAATRSLCKLR
jgi:hypothetical protein